MKPAVIANPHELSAHLKSTVSSNKILGFVPTMGCLHEGHASLISKAREQSDVVVVSIFVNPLQFGPKDDFDSYPRTFEQDIALCEKLGVDVIFAPSSKSIYPASTESVCVTAGGLSKLYCGATRPELFDGALTVVNILLNLIQPTRAFFGEKDYQQLILMKQMVRDLWLPTEIIGVPTVRAADGLALSSRNRYIDPELREKAVCLFRAMSYAQHQVQSGLITCEKLLEDFSGMINNTDQVRLDYVAVVDPQTLGSLQGPLTKPARLLGAIFVGEKTPVRLIDNVPL